MLDTLCHFDVDNRYQRSGKKLRNHVQFPERLNVTPYLTTSCSEIPVWYQLYGVIVHVGDSTCVGHYFSHVLAPDGSWYTMNDSRVGIYILLSYVAYLHIIKFLNCY